ncbi:MAG: ABC transporter substrate-binding protein [Chloroflexi bacterium]|nr:ABC transporter substrate-binding protein [Chloroflexota bacterium]
MNYFRVAATDDVQGPAAASWAVCLGAEKVFILDDTQAYGGGIANEFALHAEEIGLEVVGRGAMETPDADPRSSLTEAVAAGADLIYGGFVLRQRRPARDSGHVRRRSVRCRCQVHGSGRHLLPGSDRTGRRRCGP